MSHHYRASPSVMALSQTPARADAASAPIAATLVARKANVPRPQAKLNPLGFAPLAGRTGSAFIPSSTRRANSLVSGPPAVRPRTAKAPSFAPLSSTAVLIEEADETTEVEAAAAAAAEPKTTDQVFIGKLLAGAVPGRQVWSVTRPAVRVRPSTARVGTAWLAGVVEEDEMTAEENTAAAAVVQERWASFIRRSEAEQAAVVAEDNKSEEKTRACFFCRHGCATSCAALAEFKIEALVAVDVMAELDAKKGDTVAVVVVDEVASDEDEVECALTAEDAHEVVVAADIGSHFIEEEATTRDEGGVVEPGSAPETAVSLVEDARRAFVANSGSPFREEFSDNVSADDDQADAEPFELDDDVNEPVATAGEDEEDVSGVQVGEGRVAKRSFASRVKRFIKQLTTRKSGKAASSRLAKSAAAVAVVSEVVSSGDDDDHSPEAFGRWCAANIPPVGVLAHQASRPSFRSVISGSSASAASSLATASERSLCTPPPGVYSGGVLVYDEASVSARSLALDPLYDGSYPTAWYRSGEDGGKAADAAPAVFSRGRF